MKTLLTAAVLLLVLALAPAPAAADVGAAASLGMGMLFEDQDVGRTDASLEVLLFYKITMIKIDLAMRMDMENIDKMVQILPGVRLDVPLVYLRAAVPVNVHGPFDWGFLVGVGMDYHFMNVLGVFAELDTTIFLKEGDPSDHWPLELRAGVELTF